MRIEFRTQRPLSNGSMAEDFSVVSLDSRGEATTKGNFVGERQRMDCVISMALRTLIQERTDVVFNLFVCDEATSNVDREGSEKMREFLVDLFVWMETSTITRVAYTKHTDTQSERHIIMSQSGSKESREEHTSIRQKKKD